MTANSPVTSFVMSRPWVMLITLVGLLTYANGVSHLVVIRVAVVLVAIALFLDGGFKTNSSAQSFLLASVLLSLSAITWVLVVSTERPWLKSLCIIGYVMLAIALRHMHRHLLTRAQTSGTSVIDYRTFLIFTPMVLVMHGWLHMSPLIVSLAISALILNFRLFSRSRGASIPIVLIGNTVAAMAAREWLAREDIRVWLTYDQNFRASLATGLTRWGWTDWNAATGHPARYHWLSEATSGLLARLTGIDEFDSVVRLLPIIAIVGALLIGSASLISLGLRPLTGWIVAAITLGIHQPFAMFSIGTLWGMYLGLGLLFLLILLLTADSVHRHPWSLVVGIVVVSVMTLLSQTTVGLTVAVIVGISYFFLACLRRISLPRAVALAVLMVLAYATVALTLLKSSQSTAYEVRTRHLLHHGIIGLPDSFKAAFSPWIEPISQSLLMPFFICAIGAGTMFIGANRRRTALLLGGSYVVTSVAVINVISIGGHEERLVREGLVVATLFGLGGAVDAVIRASNRWVAWLAFVGSLTIAIAFGLFWNTPRAAQTYLVSLTAMLVIGSVGLLGRQRTRRGGVGIAVVAALSIAGSLGLFHESIERNYSILRRPIIPLSYVNGDANIDTCAEWIRTETDPNSIVASNMWRIPGGEDQKYFIVSQKTKRRMILDGPDYVANLGAFARRDDLERMKNVDDDFVGAPTQMGLRRLRAEGASFLLVDSQRIASPLIDAFARRVVSTDRCVV